MSKQEIIVDANVISLLADEKTGKKRLKAKNISGVKLVSWYLRPQKGHKNIKRDKRDNKVDW